MRYFDKSKHFLIKRTKYRPIKFSCVLKYSNELLISIVILYFNQASRIQYNIIKVSLSIDSFILMILLNIGLNVLETERFYSFYCSLCDGNDCEWNIVNLYWENRSIIMNNISMIIFNILPVEIENMYFECFFIKQVFNLLSYSL